MTRKEKMEMKHIFEEMDKEEEVAQGMESSHSGDIDYQDDAPLIEAFVSEEEDEEYTEEELSAYFENVNLEDSAMEVSFEDLMPRQVQMTGIKYQNKQNKVNNLLIIRDLVKITPSVCPLENCFYDAAKAAGFKEWDKVPESKRKLVLAVLDQHRQRTHRFIDENIIDEANIPRAWLSSADLGI